MKLVLTAVIASSLLAGIFLQDSKPVRFVHILADTERPANNFRTVCLMFCVHTPPRLAGPRPNENPDIDWASERSKILKHREKFLAQSIKRIESAKIPCQIRVLSALDTLNVFVERKDSVALTLAILKHLPTVERVLIIDDSTSQPAITTVARPKTDNITIAVEGLPTNLGQPYPVLRLETEDFEAVAPIIANKVRFCNLPDSKNLYGRLTLEDSHYVLIGPKGLWVDLRKLTIIKLAPTPK